MAILTISHEMGAGGPEIGMAVAQRLGYRYVDQELISDAAQRYGLLEEKLTHLRRRGGGGTCRARSLRSPWFGA